MKITRSNIVFVSLGIFGVILLVYLLAVISPAMERQRVVSEYIERKEKNLAEMVALQQQWRQFQQLRDEAEVVLKKRERGFSLLTYLERISRELEIAGNIQYIKPISFPESEGEMKPSGIELRYSGLDMKQLVDFLHKVENTENLLTIKRIKMQPVESDSKRNLEITLQVHTYVAAG